MQDITELKRAERNLTHVAADLARLIDTANAPIFGIDREGLINEWNDMAAKITGYRCASIAVLDFRTALLLP